MENYAFKSVAFGGFDKQDVIHYIEQTAKEAAAVSSPNRGKHSGTGRISNRPEHPYRPNEEMRSCVKPVIVHHAVFDSRTAVSHTRPAVF